MLESHLSDKELQRYNRHLLMAEFGTEAQVKLKNARVLVVGAGGLGCPCLLYLAAAGVGCLGVADGDTINLSNLQRQILYDTQDVGKSKAETAKLKLAAKNPEIQIVTFGNLTRDNVMEILPSFDLIVDGTDNFATRYLLNDACVILNKPYIYGALFKFEGHLSTFNLLDGPTYRCLYPEGPGANHVPACNEAGVLGVLPGIIGTMQAAEAIKVITGLGEPLNGKLLTVNVLSSQFETFHFHANPANKEISSLGSYWESCNRAHYLIDLPSLQALIETDEIQLIDVREEDEFERFNIGGINVPAAEFEEWAENSLNKTLKTVVVCQTGNRSLTALEYLKVRFPNLEVYNLNGGLEKAF
jgi:adenylyltransferase/sulfurtransferase